VTRAARPREGLTSDRIAADRPLVSPLWAQLAQVVADANRRCAAAKADPREAGEDAGYKDSHGIRIDG
jgi:hypothetical protein